MAKKFPKQVYVVWSEEGTLNEFLSLAESPEQHAEVGEVKRMAIYTLTETAMVRADVGVMHRKKQG